jgi:hypothetical protein
VLVGEKTYKNTTTKKSQKYVMAGQKQGRIKKHILRRESRENANTCCG